MKGAGIVIVEELEHAARRGATIYAELLGMGSTADAHHITQPHPDRRGGEHGHALALRDAKVSAEGFNTSTLTAPVRR